MSQLLLLWLNEEVRLSQRVFAFDEAFRDGYLLGEILFRFNQQLDFDQFSREQKSQATLKNFELLDLSMRKVGVPFNSRIANDVLRGNEKVTKTLLYEMKVALENLRRNCGHTIPDALRGTRSDKLVCLVTSTKPQFEKTKSRTFQIAVRNALENPNSIMMDKATRKYTDRTEDYYRTISMGESMDHATIALNRTRAKDIYKSRKDHEGEFAEAWESINLDQWRKNQKAAHERRALKTRVLDEHNRRQSAQQQRANGEARDETLQDMRHFDKHLRTMIMSDDEDPSGSPKFVRKIQVDPASQRV